MRDIVVGSGPAGIAAVLARLARGAEITVVDIGRNLEPEAEARRAVLGALEPADWRSEDRAAYLAPNHDAKGAILRFGSDFAVAPENATFSESEGVDLRSSHAVGGFSNVWGAAVLPWPAAEMADWPVTAEDLAPHYEAVSGIVPVAGRPAPYDDLLAGGAMLAPALPPTAQGAALLERIERLGARLAVRGLHAGPARQAVAPGCKACGMCLYGCPYGLIFSARPLVEDLARSDRISYRTGCVRRIEETGDGVRVHLDGGETVEGARVFVAAGVLGTARIQFASDPALAGRSLKLKESAHGFTPFLSSWRAPGTGKGPHHTLVQAFVEMVDPDVSPHVVHSQLYGWNDLYAPELSAKYGRGIRALDPVFEAVARRLIVAQTFLHSDHCPEILLTPAPGDREGRLVARVSPRPGFGAAVARARARLARGLRAVGLHAITPAGRVGAPGSSYHVGGSLPMARQPAPGETDALGRPAGWERLHVVDASVMPAIPATTITLSVMANAHRIATHV